jgi:hypothetical protein
VLRKKNLKALGMCLSFIDQEVINEIIIIDDMPFTQLWNALEYNYGVKSVEASERLKSKIQSIKLDK